MSFAASAKKRRESALPLPEVAAVLRKHPGVDDVAACRTPNSDGPAHAFVVANESYLDEVLGRKEAENAQLRKWRKTYDLSQLAKLAVASPFAFNIAGWNSSYTRQPLPAEDMREWIQSTVDRISALAPREVLEIGCGTGLLLLRLASSCKRYVGMDFAPAVLARLREQLTQTHFSDKVELLERTADDFSGFAENSVDLVIINSVAQYFPSRAYLDRVMENAIRVVRPGGHVFIGDKRNFALHYAHAVSIEAFQSTPETTVAELRDRVKRRLHQEQELVPSPAYFLSTQQRFRKISRVAILPRRGERDNEMTRFRYDAILSIARQTVPALDLPFREPSNQGWALKDLRSQLNAGKADAVGFARIRNARVDKDVLLAERLSVAPSDQSLADLSKGLGRVESIHPEEIVRLAKESGYEVALNWASCYSDGSYDAVFVRHASAGGFPVVNWPEPALESCVYFSNAARQAEIREKLTAELISHCAQIPRTARKHIHLVDSIPQGNDGADFYALLSATENTFRF